MKKLHSTGKRGNNVDMVYSDPPEPIWVDLVVRGLPPSDLKWETGKSSVLEFLVRYASREIRRGA